MTPARVLLPDRVLELLEERASRSGRTVEAEAAVALALLLRREAAEAERARLGELGRGKLATLRTT